MAHRIADRVKETASTSGTGSFTLAGAVGGFVTFDSHLTSNGDTCWYSAVNGSEWEVGLGTRSSAGVLARSTVLASSNAGALVNFTVAPTVFLTVPAAALVMASGPAFRATLSADQTGVSTATFTKILLNTEEFDTNGCYDNATNYRFTPNVPGYYRLEWLVFSNSTTLTGITANIRKNGTNVGESLYIPISSAAQRTSGNRLIYLNGTTDYVELWGYLVGTGLKFVSGTVETSFSGSLVRPA